MAENKRIGKEKKNSFLKNELVSADGFGLILYIRMTIVNKFKIIFRTQAYMMRINKPHSTIA